MLKDYEIAIVGGGPAGSTVAILLARAGFNVCLFEKKKFPREVLCGEFLSQEVTNILKNLNLFDEFLSLKPNPIKTLSFFFGENKKINTSLNFEAYGLKRSVFDNFILCNAKKSGVKVFQPCSVKNIIRKPDYYRLETIDESKNINEVKAKIVICAYGKTDFLDKKLNRKFAGKKSKLNGIKFHLPSDMFNNINQDEIRIYVSDGIYCGINSVSEKEITVCFLENRKKQRGESKNHLIELFFNKYKFSNPVVESFKKELATKTIYGTGNIYFGRKNIIENGIYMVGDASGIIAPLSGDGIGIAMESAVLLADILQNQRENKLSKKETETLYKNKWKKLFKQRLSTSSILQKIMFNKIARNIAYGIVISKPNIINSLIERTRNTQAKYNGLYL